MESSLIIFSSIWRRSQRGSGSFSVATFLVTTYRFASRTCDLSLPYLTTVSFFFFPSPSLPTLAKSSFWPCLSLSTLCRYSSSLDAAISFFVTKLRSFTKLNSVKLSSYLIFSSMMIGSGLGWYYSSSPFFFRIESDNLDLRLLVSLRSLPDWPFFWLTSLSEFSLRELCYLDCFLDLKPAVRGSISLSSWCIGEAAIITYNAVYPFTRPAGDVAALRCMLFYEISFFIYVLSLELVLYPFFLSDLVRSLGVERVSNSRFAFSWQTGLGLTSIKSTWQESLF